MTARVYVVCAELASSLAYLQQPLYNLAALPEEPLKSRLEELQEVTLNLLVVSESVGSNKVHLSGIIVLWLNFPMLQCTCIFSGVISGAS